VAFDYSTQYWWPLMALDVKTYRRTCDIGQCFQKTHPKFDFTGEFRPKALFHAVAVDYAGPFALTALGNQYFILAIEVLTRWVWVKIVPSATTQNVVDFFRDQIIPTIGVPVEVWCDRGSHFLGDPFNSACQKFVPAPSYISEHNGLAERAIQSVERSLEKLSAGKPHEWDLHISTAIFTQRICVHTKTKTTAAELMFGQKLCLPGDPEPVLNPVYGDHTNIRFLELEVLASNRFEQYLKYGDKQSAEVHYKIGDKVFVAFQFQRECFVINLYFPDLELILLLLPLWL
jgi:hypothetical protein